MDWFDIHTLSDQCAVGCRFGLRQRKQRLDEKPKTFIQISRTLFFISFAWFIYAVDGMRSPEIDIIWNMSFASAELLHYYCVFRKRKNKAMHWNHSSHWIISNLLWAIDNAPTITFISHQFFQPNPDRHSHTPQTTFIISSLFFVRSHENDDVDKSNNNVNLK